MARGDGCVTDSSSSKLAACCSIWDIVIYINNGCPVRAGDSIISISMQVLYQNICYKYILKFLINLSTIEYEWNL